VPDAIAKDLKQVYTAASEAALSTRLPSSAASGETPLWSQISYGSPLDTCAPGSGDAATDQEAGAMEFRASASKALSTHSPRC
jgi:hypothetical protein